MSVDAEALLDQLLAVAKRDADAMRDANGPLLPEQAATLQGYIRVLTAYVKGARKTTVDDVDMEELLEKVAQEPMLQEALRRGRP